MVMNSIKQINRKEFLNQMLMMSAIMMVPGTAFSQIRWRQPRVRINFGLVTYQWGKDWDIPTLIDNLTSADIFGVELRVDHAHDVTPELSRNERREIRKRFKGSPVQIIGIGTNQQFDYPDRAKLRESIDKTVEYIILSKDIGGTGVKVKPNQFHPGVPKSRTVDQIGRALNQLARIGADNGQQIRLEVHGTETQEIEIIKDIMDVADHPNATVCWNSNPEDLKGRGLEGNFNLLKDRFGAVTHVRELDDPEYPYEELIKLFVDMNYRGWIMLEGRTEPADKVQALIEQRNMFEQMVEKALNT
jgi:sugar phosphate isomerase/epimerase